MQVNCNKERRSRDGFSILYAIFLCIIVLSVGAFINVFYKSILWNLPVFAFFECLYFTGMYQMVSYEIRLKKSCDTL